MKFTLKKPCKHCPFRNDITPFLTTGRAEQIMDSLYQGASFPCHKTVEYGDNEDGVVTRNSQHCAGALIMLEKMEESTNMMRVAERLGMYDHTKLNMESPVFEDADEFIFAQGEIA